ncbi:MAG: hypothetical protein AAF591_05910 [Verrucomicrobiota bacterium]
MRGVVVILIWVCLGEVVWGQAVIRQEIPSRFAPGDLIKETMGEVLSPDGRFVILGDKGAILVIDTPDKVMAAAAAMEALDVPAPNVALNLGVRTGGQARVMGPVNDTTGIPYPTRYLPPRVPSSVVGPPGFFPVLPAHPTGFVTRNVGDTMETTPTVNPDGSITLDINMESTQFEGFMACGVPMPIQPS